MPPLRDPHPCRCNCVPCFLYVFPIFSFLHCLCPFTSALVNSLKHNPKHTPSLPTCTDQTAHCPWSQFDNVFFNKNKICFLPKCILFWFLFCKLQNTVVLVIFFIGSLKKQSQFRVLFMQRAMQPVSMIVQAKRFASNFLGRLLRIFWIPW